MSQSAANCINIMIKHFPHQNIYQILSISFLLFLFMIFFHSNLSFYNPPISLPSDQLAMFNNNNSQPIKESSPKHMNIVYIYNNYNNRVQ